MHSSRVFFKISDIFNHPLRNYKRFSGVKVERNLVFDGRFGKFTKADIYYAPSDKPLPVFVNVHGGGFVCGDKKYRSGIARLIASNGWFVVNVNYRLAPKYTYPAPTEDVINALNFVNTLKDKYNIDTKKIVLSGDSAGGYYAAHAAAATFSPELRAMLNLPEYTGEKIRSLLTFCAPFNLEKCFTKKTPLGISTDITNCVFGTKFRGYGYEFPERQSSNVLNFVNKDWCEVFISAAERDSFCGGQVEAMKEKLEACGVKAQTYIASMKGDSHCSHLLPFMKGSKANMEAVLKYLEGIRNEKA
ncbi:MAG: alpha/beta hydrolase [Clostridiales bacterium]|jgi:acetyl esterase|nr:alpha/beta hydrolase [Clostridiales bacterium]HOB64821.1 alpha/beta hydrolase [Clostridia bacterium]HOK82174.1 alpha/beta hydrolase [Clostridia bacterium]HOL61183.1 alpha/beta hydrolase [Clostridia bacterium]HPO53843.1 alpha/beta hydrolase [Clostridia bacterium]